MSRASVGCPLVMGCLWLFCCLRGSAQVLLPEGYEQKCRLTHQEVIILHHQGKEWLGIEARYQLEAPPVDFTSGRYTASLAPAEDSLFPPPERMGWVIPLPAGAVSLSAPGEDLFQVIYDFTHPSPKMKYHLRTRRPLGLSRFGEDLLASDPPETLEKPIDWRILEGTPESVLLRLDQWVRSRRLSGLNRSLAEEYAERGWTFAVGILDHPAGEGLLGPALFRFPARDVLFPLRFQADAGEFDFTVYLFADGERDRQTLRNWRINGINAWENLHRDAWFKGYTRLSDTNPPEPLVEFLASVTGRDSVQKLFFYALEGKRLNGYGKTTADLEMDFVLSEKTIRPEKASKNQDRKKKKRGLRRAYFRRARWY